MLDRKSEAERTDMGYAAKPIDHDVPVVAVLDLDDVAEKRVGGHRLDEVGARFLEVDSVGAAVLENEEASKVVDLGATHLVSRRRVWNHVDDTALAEEDATLAERTHRKGAEIRTPGPVAVTQIGRAHV